MMQLRHSTVPPRLTIDLEAAIESQKTKIPSLWKRSTLQHRILWTVVTKWTLLWFKVFVLMTVLVHRHHQQAELQNQESLTFHKLGATLTCWCLVSLSDSFLKKPQSLLCHYFDVAFLVKILLLCVQVVQFLVQWLNEQLEILRKSLGIAVFPEPTLSRADVVQHILDFVAVRLPNAVHEDWVLYENHILVRLASILLMLLPLPRARFASW